MEQESADLVTATARRSMLTVICQGCLETPYVQLIVPADLEKVRTITVQLTSHDQGFSHVEDRFGGTYEGSFSWFDIAIVAPDGHTRMRWRACENLHARSHWQTVSHTWPKEQVLEHKLGIIRPNDTIQLLPQVHFQAWRNYVSGAEISVTGTKSLNVSSRSLDNMLSSNPSGVYLPLSQDQQETRLLSLLPGTGIIECVLRSSQLTAGSDPYEALSYCWGDAQHTKTIRVSGHAFQVTENLHNALQKLRSPTSARTLWIDAVCINQQDLAERAWQVQMMRTVYANASQVLVWLGDPATLFWHQAISGVRDIFERNKVDSAVSHSEDDPPQLTMSQPLSQDELMKEYPWFIDDCYMLLECPWFSRVWVLQEVFHASKVVILCGDQAISWSCVLHINAFTNHAVLRSIPKYTSTMAPLFSDLFAITQSVSQDDQERRLSYMRHFPSGNILDLVVAGLGLDATNPRDKIFALLSLLPPSETLAIRPDYTQSTADVFGNFTRQWIASHKSLRILSAVHCSVGRTWRRQPPLPVVPTTDRPTWSLWHDGNSLWGYASLGLQKCAYSASGATTTDAALLAHNDHHASVLRLRGVTIGTIARIEPFPYFAEDNYTDLREAYDKVFPRAGSQGSAGTTTLGRQPSLLADHWDTHIDYARQTGGAIECHPPCFITTSEGRKGLCPSMARVGDRIVVLYGGAVPYLVRDVTDSDQLRSPPASHEFVGECYVSGYMTGEALDMPQEEHEIFKLV